MNERLRAAFAFHQAGQFRDAENAYREILAADATHFAALYYLGLLRLQTGAFQEAERVIAQALAVDPGSLAALSVHATALHHLGRGEDAIAALDRLLRLHPDSATGWNNRGNLLLETGRVHEAAENYKRAIALQPDYAQAWHNLGVAKIRVTDYRGAEADLNRALQLKPTDADAMEHLGVALGMQECHAEALGHYEDALRLKPANPALLCRRAHALLQLNRPDEALVAYDAALAREAHGDALMGRGALLHRLQRYGDALADFDRAIALHPDNEAAWQGRGAALAQLNHDEAALAAFREALRLQPADSVSLYNCASLLARHARYEEAAGDLETLLAVDADFPLARGLSMHVRLHLCDWHDLTKARQEISDALQRGKRALYPFGHLAISDSPAEQAACAHLTAEQMYPAMPSRPHAKQRHEKLRVAYVSGDFYQHAIPCLIAGVFEHHDRARFEFFGVSCGPSDTSAMRRRLEHAFQHFSDMREKTDAEIAGQLRSWEIDIAVDLKGYTGGARPGILAYRPAPIQVQYLGYPGTMGADYIDYLIADRTVIPEEHRAFYAEKIVYLPDTYQPNDSRRRSAADAPDRAAAGLPQGAFVYCCFNGCQKIMPETFRLWMEILSDVKDSVLWLLEGHPAASVNLRREAAACGIAPERLIFAKHMPLEDHLARLRLADLVLDTLPYGAHTTASDALWAGVPVLTRLGASFAGRVAVSLLSAVGLPELIAHSDTDYKSLAAALAQNAARLTTIRQKLAANRETTALFDTARVTRNLEAAYLGMWERHRCGIPPESFAVAAGSV